jgi:hypothetical protein
MVRNILAYLKIGRRLDNRSTDAKEAHFISSRILKRVYILAERHDQCDQELLRRMPLDTAKPCSDYFNDQLIQPNYQR